ncbi:MAG: hypothetical protein WAO36_04770 [Candidatus Methanoculleus thermohydrogenotrophicum]
MTRSLRLLVITKSPGDAQVLREARFPAEAFWCRRPLDGLDVLPERQRARALDSSAPGSSVTESAAFQLTLLACPPIIGRTD